MSLGTSFWPKGETRGLLELSQKDKYKYFIIFYCNINEIIFLISFCIQVLLKLISPLFLEKAMAPHSSTLAWKIPWKEEPCGLQSMGLLRVGHDWATSLSLFTFMHWRRKWQPTPVFLPGESQGRGSLVGCCLWGRTVRHDWSDLAAAAAADLLPI